MTKDIKQVQEENRKACNPDCNCTNGKVWSDDWGWEDCEYCQTTLNRVLLALGKNHGILCNNIVFWSAFGYENLCRWDLTKPTLEEQSQQTQRSIHKLLTTN